MSTTVLKQVARFTGPAMLGMALLVIAGLALLFVPPADTFAQEPGPITTQAVTQTAYMVVRYGDNDNIVRRINFTGAISEQGALELAGLNPTVDGGFLTHINGYEAKAAETRFWGTSHISGTGWTFNRYGVTELEIRDNFHVEGFSVSDPGWSGVDPPAPQRMAAAADGLQWLSGQQSTTDGGYGNTSKSIEALMAVGANGCDPAEWRNGAGNPALLTYLSADRVATFAADASGAGKAAVALAAAQQVITDYKGLNLVISITTHYSDTSGAYHPDPGGQAWAMMGLRAASQTVPLTASNYLTGLTKIGGCWAWGSNKTWFPRCDTNGTALAVQALVAAGIPTDSAAVISGITWLKSAQNSDGGFPYDPQSPWGTDSDTNSTSYAVQALLAAGEDISSLANGSPIDYLQGMQQSTGQFYWQGDSPGADATSPTRQAVLALLDRPLPTASVAGLTSFVLSEKSYISYFPLIIKDS